jgi:DTW domain-containing protein YfiP
MKIMHGNRCITTQISRLNSKKCFSSETIPSVKASSPLREKMNQHAVNRLHLRSMILEQKNRCMKCFCKTDVCMCQRIQQILSPVQLPCQLTVFTHYKEWGKSSNTGKILKFGLSRYSKEFIFGVHDDEVAFLRELESMPSIVLYPSPKSIPITDMKDWYAKHNGKINLCVIDSTWGQSGPMTKFIPSTIPRVHVNELIVGPSLYLNRRQSPLKYKVSTVESVCYALRGLGEQASTCDPLFDALKFSVDTVFFQRNSKTVYGSKFVKSTKHDQGNDLIS